MRNFTRDPAATLQDALQKGYHRLRFQQGKPILDRELNLLGDLATPERIAEHHIGNGVPADSDGFRIGALNVVANDFTIGAGRCLVGGQEVVLATDTTYQGQPVTTNVAPPPAGSSNVYLRVFRSEGNGAQDADLQNGGTGNVGFETAVRERVQWEVLVTGAVIATSDHLLLATITLPAGTVADLRRANLTLAPLRDEIVLARGTTAQLSDRLAASLQDDGVLKPNSVGTSQIAANAVTAAGLQSDPVNATQRAVGKNHVQNGAVSISQLTST